MKVGNPIVLTIITIGGLAVIPASAIAQIAVTPERGHRQGGVHLHLPVDAELRDDIRAGPQSLQLGTTFGMTLAQFLVAQDGIKVHGDVFAPGV
jgi:hypothetical protein